MKYKVTRLPGSPGLPIPEGEPCFIIRAQDAFAVRAVQAYIDLTRDVVSPEMTADLIQVRERIAHYQIDHAPKMPD